MKEKSENEIISDKYKPTPTPESVDYIFKVRLVGDSKVGKSTLVQRFILEKFINLPSSDSATAHTKDIQVDNKRIRLQVIDRAALIGAGETGLSKYYRSISVPVTLLIFDITNEYSFNKLNDYLRDEKQRTNKFILIGAKSDLENLRIVTYDGARKFATELGMPYIETSALKGMHVTAMFEEAVRMILRASKEQPEIKQVKPPVKQVESEIKQVKPQVKQEPRFFTNTPLLSPSDFVAPSCSIL